MRYTKVEFTGGAGTFAVISRDWSSPSIQAQVIRPGGTTTDACLAADRDGQWNLAARLQKAVDGVRGTPSEIREVFDAILRLAD